MKLSLIDARGRSCPEPVLITKKSLELHSEGIKVLVDNTTARDNIKRFAGNLRYSVKIDKKDEDFILTIQK